MPMPTSDLKRRLLCEGWIDPENAGAAGSIFLPVLRYCRQGNKVWIAEGDEFIPESRTLQEAQQNDGVEIVESIDILELEERVLPNGAKTKLPKDGIWVVEGPAQRSDVKNANKRTYGRSIWERLIADAESPVQKTIKARGMIGHLEHPKDGRTDGKEGALVVTEANLRDDGVVWAKFELLDTPNGLILQEYTKKNVRWGVSSRGTGKVDETGKVIDESYMLETWDAVMRPSTPGAFPKMAEGDDGLEEDILDEARAVVYAVDRDQTVSRMKEIIDGFGGKVVPNPKGAASNTIRVKWSNVADMNRFAKEGPAGIKRVGETNEDILDEQTYHKGKGWSLGQRHGEWVVSLKAKEGKGHYAVMLGKKVSFDDDDKAIEIAKRFAKQIAAGKKVQDLVHEDADAESYEEIDEAVMHKANITASFAKVFTNFDDQPMSVLLASLAEALDSVTPTTVGGSGSVESVTNGLQSAILKAANRLAKMDEGEDADPSSSLIEEFESLQALDEADVSMVGRMLDVFGKTVDLAAEGNLAVEKANEMSAWLTRKVKAIVDSGGGNLDESIDRALAALGDVDEDEDPRDKVIESLREQLMLVSTEVDDLRQKLEGTNSEVAAVAENRDDALERLTEAEERARALQRKLDLANELLAQRPLAEANGDVMEAVGQAVKDVPGLARFRKVLQRAQSRTEVLELAETLLPAIAKPTPQRTPAVPRTALPVGNVISESVTPPKGGPMKDPSPGAQMAAKAVGAKRQNG